MKYFIAFVIILVGKIGFGVADEWSEMFILSCIAFALGGFVEYLLVDNDTQRNDIQSDAVMRNNNNPRFKIKHETTLSGQQRNTGKVKVNAVTRPKQCVLCRTENKITRTSNAEWQCTACGHTWR